MTLAIDPGPLGPALDLAYRRLEQSRFSEALWRRRVDVWTNDSEIQRRISGRLGWLDVIDAMRPHVPRLHDFARSVVQAGFTDVVLLGMGGSSLAAEVLRASIGITPGFPRFQMLDSVDPEAVRAAMDRAATTLFILASKSGATIELTTLAAEAQRRLEAAGAAPVGSHLIAITDENTVLHRRGIEQQFRELFINPPDIGGRFSALSLFGLVPAALMGIDVDALLASAAVMAGLCQIDDPRRNPGLALGAFVGAASMEGRDKLTLLLAEPFERFGLWAEQLVAESTGKAGKGVVPIIGNGFDETRAEDRAIVAISEGHSTDAALAARARTAGIPIAAIHVSDRHALGAEFLRWEIAIATAGWLLGVNPFDEPNVQQAKDATRALLERFSTTGRLPIGEPDASIDGIAIRLTAAARAELHSAPPTALLPLPQRGEYFGLLAYLSPQDEAFHRALKEIRRAISTRTGCATTFGYGPRYLHSTGQLHKGGPNSGVFLILTAEPLHDLPVPGAPYSFGVLELAQALGDFDSLEQTGRRAVHVHLPRRDPLLLQQIAVRLLAD